MGYAYPSSTRTISCSWQCHKDRNPPSTEPGTDYASAYGQQLYAPGDGTIVDLKNSNSNATGRFITIDLTDGRRTRSLHLSTTGSAYVGQRVTRGQAISGAKTGASGYGSDWGYGAHVHQTLWSTQAYNFCSTCTIDFNKYVGDAPVQPNQRVVGPNGANGRPQPNTSGAVTQTLPPGTVADFDGWINGEAVEGNKVWFRGAYSGDFFWSGGFTSKSTSGLKDLNTTLTPTQRQAGPNGANGRSQPNTQVPVTNTLAPGAIGNFDGWINGETVEGNKVWFRGTSGNFFWSGGFTDKGTHDLKDLNTPAPVPTERTVASPNSANVRALPYTSSPALWAEDPGTVIDMKAYTRGEVVSGNDVWFQRKSDSNWMWSGGFTQIGNSGLPEVPTPEPPPTPNPDNPRGLPEYAPVYPAAIIGLEAPLGFTDCKNPVTRTPRNKAGADQHPVDPVIDTYIIHWTATLTDQTDYFSTCNSRSVCPTFYMRRDGKVLEMIRPMAKPAATGPDWNWRSLATETLAQPGSDFTPEQWEAHAQIIAWLAEFDGKTLDGVPVEFKISREHVLGHRECLPGTTECPGDAQIAGMDALITRAQAIYDENHPTDPCKDCPDCPECPECPPGTLDPEAYPALYALNEELARAFGEEAEEEAPQGFLSRLGLRGDR